MSQGQQPSPKDAVRVAQNALQRMAELEATVEQQADTIDNLQQRVVELESGRPDPSEYARLDRPTKAALVREHLIERAEDNGGRAKIDYEGIRWEVFNGEPSVGHAYTLMDDAADACGFETVDPRDDNKHLRVNTAEINREKATGELSRVNNNA